MELIFNPCGEFRCSPEGPVSQIHSLHFLAGASLTVSDILRSVQKLKREWGADSNGKLPHVSVFIPSQTATLVPTVVCGGSIALRAELHLSACVYSERPTLGQNTNDDDDDDDDDGRDHSNM